MVNIRTLAVNLDLRELFGPGVEEYRLRLQQSKTPTRKKPGPKPKVKETPTSNHVEAAND